VNDAPRTKKRFWLDTNIIIRFITSDHQTMLPEVTTLMQQAENGQIILKVSPIVIAECCWVLQSAHYGFTPSDISGVLTSFVLAEGIEAEELDTVLYALDQYAAAQVDFVDAYLAALSRTDQTTVITYNIKDFRKMRADCCRPAEIAHF
jgi:predicted nucleic-acid-binding protein